MEKVKCPKCGNELQNEVLNCSNCGFPIKQWDKLEQPIYKNKKYIGAIMCIMGCILFIVAITRISNDDYKFYMEHYETCMQGYDENTATANSYVSGILASGYENIASNYKEMAEDDYEKIWKYRIQALVACGASLILLVIGYKKVKGKGEIIMALIKCPECGRDISDMANSCPNCGFVVKKEKVDRKNNTMPVIAMIIVLGIICAIWYQLDQSKKDNLSYSKSYYDSYDYPKTGNEGALAKAKSYLNSSAFSYTGLIEQLEYNGFSESEAKYGADNCGADWKEQALKKAKSYLGSSAFSYTELIDQLEYNGFREEEAEYGADNCGADWKEQAAKKAKSYLKSSSFSRSELIEQLEYNGFTYEQAIYGVEQNGM